jgi:hypothetical protein
VEVDLLLQPLLQVHLEVAELKVSAMEDNQVVVVDVLPFSVEELPLQMTL